MRFANILLVLAVLAAAFFTYTLEHATREAERRIAALGRDIAAEREAMKLLKAEWSSLVHPARLQKLAERHLGLKPISPGQIATVAEAAARIPDVPPHERQGTDDPIAAILEKMQ